MEKLLFIINPNSGRKDSKASLLDALETFSKKYEMTVYCTDKELACYEKILEVGHNYDVIVVSGGDGTLNEATNALMTFDKKPLLGYIPSGTMNDFSKNFNLSNSFSETSQKIVKERWDEFDVGRINGQYFNYVAGFGAFTRVSYETERELKQNIGDIAYFLTGLTELPNIKPFHVKMEIDDEVYENDVLVGLIINSYRVSGMEIVEKTNDLMKDGLFDVLLIEDTQYLFQRVNYPIGLFNPDQQVPYVKRVQARHIKVRFDEEIEWTLDGERGPKGLEFEIENINKPLKILY